MISQYNFSDGRNIYLQWKILFVRYTFILYLANFINIGNILQEYYKGISLNGLGENIRGERAT